jgi:hypothetical protein
MDVVDWAPAIVVSSVVLEFTVLLLIPRLGPNGKGLAFLITLVTVIGCAVGFSYMIGYLYRGHSGSPAVWFRIANGCLFTFLVSRILFLLAVTVQNPIAPKRRVLLLASLLGTYAGGLAYLITALDVATPKGAITITAVHVIAVFFLGPLALHFLSVSDSTRQMRRIRRISASLLQSERQAAEDSDLGPE